jgi:2-(1,2-epoxy-1,2-dihydrophenyl)acetyl-CoA isomerase
MSSVLVENEGPVRVLTLVNEGKLNAFDGPMLSALVRELRTADEDAAVGAVVITGAGGAFCSGGDVSAMAATTSPQANHRFLTEEIHRVPKAIMSSKKAVIAMINGVAVGAGLDIALACDLRTCSTTAHLAEGYIKAGLAAGDGGAWLLPRLIGVGRAMDLLLSGRRIPADEALQIGLVTSISEPESLRADTMAMAASLAQKPPHALAAMKRLIRHSLDVSFDVGLDLAAEAVARLQAGDEHREAVSRLRSGRKES